MKTEVKKYLRDRRSPMPKSELTSKTMSAIRAKNTKPEVLLRKELWKLGARGFRLHYKSAPGRPDIVFVRPKVAVFVNGCFWHRCPKCYLPIPKNNSQFWKNKFEKNIQRDQRKIELLKKEGWKVIVVWECELKESTEKSTGKLINILSKASNHLN